MRPIKFAKWVCMPTFGLYANGRVALTIGNKECPVVARPSVNLGPTMPDLPLGLDELHIKNYAENAGIVDALVEAGLVVVMETIGIGEHKAEVARCSLTPAALDLLAVARELAE